MPVQIAFAAYPLALAVVALALILTARSAGRAQWIVDIAAGVSVAAFAYLTGPWAFTSYYLRYALIGFIALALVQSCRRRTFNEVRPNRRLTPRFLMSASVLVVFTLLNLSVVVSHVGERESINLSFPLFAGRYYVLQGGNSWAGNPFHALSGSGGALDLVRLNVFGNRARGPAPHGLEDYEIFGDTIRSPCAGTVTSMRSDAPDHAPGEADTERPEGNYVVVKCGDVEILMAHMMRNSVATGVGDTVSLGQPLGRVGNSGNTLEPHLHIEARRNGEGVELLFNGRRLSVNDVVVRRQ